MKVKATPNATMNAKVVRAMKKIQAWYDNEANKIIKGAA